MMGQTHRRREVRKVREVGVAAVVAVAVAEGGAARADRSRTMVNRHRVRSLATSLMRP